MSAEKSPLFWERRRQRLYWLSECWYSVPLCPSEYSRKHHTVTTDGKQSLAPTFHVDVPVMRPPYLPQNPRSALEMPVPFNSYPSSQTALLYPAMHEVLPPPETLWRTRPARRGIYPEQIAQSACRPITELQPAFVYVDEEQALSPAHFPAIQNITKRRLLLPGTERDNQVSFSNNGCHPTTPRLEYEGSHCATAPNLPSVGCPDRRRSSQRYESHSYVDEMPAPSKEKQKLEQQMTAKVQLQVYQGMAHSTDH